MNRLTEKINNYYFSKDNIEGDHDVEINKLGELEDIEEELGIDLIKLFNIEKVYWRKKTYKSYSIVYEAYKVYVDIANKCLAVYNEYDEFGHSLYFKDYGDTWALTEKELKDEQ